MAFTPSASSPAFSVQHAPSPLPSQAGLTPRPTNQASSLNPRRAGPGAGLGPGAPPSASARASTAGTQGVSGVSLEDPKVELSRTIGLVLGVDGSEGGGELGALADKLELGARAFENAFDEDAPPCPSPASLLAHLAQLQSLLRSSPIGAAPLLPPGQLHPPGGTDLTALGREQGAAVQALFKQRQRAKEGAEVAASVVGAA